MFCWEDDVPFGSRAEEDGEVEGCGSVGFVSRVDEGFLLLLLLL